MIRVKAVGTKRAHESSEGSSGGEEGASNIDSDSLSGGYVRKLLLSILISNLADPRF